jgi:hypothetical protein
MELWNFILEVQSLRANSGGACVFGFSPRTAFLYFQKISKVNRRLHWQDLSHRLLLRALSVLGIYRNLRWGS